jgi:co-chaperonin GroES (HSP10)
MGSKIERLKPANRHLLIVPHVQKNETNTGVLLPDDYKQEEARYIEASVVDVADDCDKQFKHLRLGNIENNKVVIDRTMVEEVKLKDKTHFLILENYVVGVYRRANES